MSAHRICLFIIIMVSDLTRKTSLVEMKRSLVCVCFFLLDSSNATCALDTVKYCQFGEQVEDVSHLCDIKYDTK